MAALDIYIDSRLLEGIAKLAIDHYGEDSELSRQRVVETALEMRVLWSRSVKQGQGLTDEAISGWQFSEALASRENTKDIQDWLFRR